MKNKALAFLAAVIICLCIFAPAVAAEGLETVPDLVADNADVLTDEQEDKVEVDLIDIGSANNLEIAVLTVDSYDGKDPQAYADDYYDYNGIGYGVNRDGLVIVYNTGRLDGNRNLTVSTCGRAISLFTDAEIDEIFDMMIPYIKGDDVYAAFACFNAACEEAISGEFIFYDDETVYDSDDIYSYDDSYEWDDYRGVMPLYYIPLAIAIGFIVAFVIVKIQASGLKSVRSKADAADYVGNAVITAQHDAFLYRNIKRTPKPKNNGGSVHTGSSGRSHGGGSRSF